MVDKEVISIKQWCRNIWQYMRKNPIKEHIKRKVAEGDGCWIVA